MKSLDERYVRYFTPLVREFVSEVSLLKTPAVRGTMAEPFLPLFGDRYGTSALRMVIIGQDTRGWGDLNDFVEAERKTPGSKLRDGLAEFRAHPFRSWGPRPQSFWGFSMMILAALYGREDWAAMKHGAMSEILDSFAWGNGNAIELYGSTASRAGVPRLFWDEVRRAGKRFDRFQHIYESIQPNVALILYRGLDLAAYFDPYRIERVSSDGRLSHFWLPDIDVDVFHAPHPVSMNRIEGVHHFRDRLTKVFARRDLSAVYSKFIAEQKEGEHAVQQLAARAPKAGEGCDRFECIAWVADELRKHDVFMSVPRLCELLNQLGYRTSYGSTFSGGRGSYRLVSCAYQRVHKQSSDRAKGIARSFLRPNFEYAYKAD